MFGINDNGKQQDGSTPVAEPTVVQAPDASASSDSPAPVMPGPSPDMTSASESGLSDSSVITPIVTPAIPPAPEPGATAEPVETTTAPTMPETKPHEEEEPAPSGINGVSLENAYIPTGSSQISSNYSKPAPTAASLMNDANGDDLLGIKKQALQSLAPLVDELDQTPEEKFKTTMMLIQASDNADLVKDAFAAANQITDEKIRAQALLDVVNEINYFTQPHHEEEPESI